MSVRRLVMIAGLCATPVTALHSQEPKPTESSRLATVGVLLGMSSTTVTGTVAGDEPEGRLRPAFGAWILVNVVPRIQLEIDGLFSAKGYRAPNSTRLTELSAAYLEVPALMRFNFAPSAKLQPFIGAGGAVGYRFRCTAKTPSGQYAGGLGCDDVVNGAPLYVARTETSGVLGAGLDLLTRSARFSVGARLTQSFNSVFETLNNHNRAIMLYVSIGRSTQYF